MCLLTWPHKCLCQNKRYQRDRNKYKARDCTFQQHLIETWICNICLLIRFFVVVFFFVAYTYSKYTDITMSSSKYRLLSTAVCLYHNKIPSQIRFTKSNSFQWDFRDSVTAPPLEAQTWFQSWKRGIMTTISRIFVITFSSSKFIHNSYAGKNFLFVKNTASNRKKE